jgi:hypothetical protein
MTDIGLPMSNQATAPHFGPPSSARLAHQPAASVCYRNRLPKIGHLRTDIANLRAMHAQSNALAVTLNSALPPQIAIAPRRC